MQVAAVILSETNDTITRSLWSIIVNNSLTWSQEGWGAFINAESAVFVTPLLNTSAANASMSPLLEFGLALNESGVPGVEVIFTEFPSWGSFFFALAGTDSAVGSFLIIFHIDYNDKHSCSEQI